MSKVPVVYEYGEPVAGKGFDAEQFLHGAALFLFFLHDVTSSNRFAVWK